MAGASDRSVNATQQLSPYSSILGRKISKNRRIYCFASAISFLRPGLHVPSLFDSPSRIQTTPTTSSLQQKTIPIACAEYRTVLDVKSFTEVEFSNRRFILKCRLCSVEKLTIQWVCACKCLVRQNQCVDTECSFISRQWKAEAFCTVQDGSGECGVVLSDLAMILGVLRFSVEQIQALQQLCQELGEISFDASEFVFLSRHPPLQIHESSDVSHGTARLESLAHLSELIRKSVHSHPLPYLLLTCQKHKKASWHHLPRALHVLSTRLLDVSLHDQWLKIHGTRINTLTPSATTLLVTEVEVMDVVAETRRLLTSITTMQNK